jgi:hypothetical protein
VELGAVGLLECEIHVMVVFALDIARIVVINLFLDLAFGVMVGSVKVCAVRADVI